MAAKKSNSLWLWVFLLLILAPFAGFIFFLDQKIVRHSHSQHDTKPMPHQNPDRTRPTIDFYTVLPDRKVEITPREKPQDDAESPATNETSSNQILLQVGSFKSINEADSLKAELAFMGLEAKVKSARLQQETWYRVQVGPFASNSALSQVKNLLLENNIQYLQRRMSQ